MADKPLCSIPGCGKQRQARGWCKWHHRRWQLYGDPNGSAGRTPIGAPKAFLNLAFESAAPEECILWPYTRIGLGYGRLYVDGAMQLAHRVICKMAHGAPPSEGHHAAHSCGQHACVNRHHIRWASKTENERDKIKHGVSNRGERSNTARLSREQVYEIRALCDAGQIKQAAIASRFGVKEGHVYQIGARLKWKWLPERQAEQ